MKKIIIFTFLFLIHNSCSNNDPFWFLDIDNDYNKVKKEFKDYIDFFPKYNQATCKVVTWSLDKETEFNLKVVFSFSKTEFEKILKNIKKKSIAQYSSSSKCLLVLNRFDTHENYGSPESDEIQNELIDLPCYKNLYPIPNFSVFSDYYSDKTTCKLKKGFSIYVLDAKPGFFLKQNKLTEGKYMPVYWKNGFSKGVAINEKERIAIYWIIIW